MEHNQLRAFVEIAKVGQLTRAAERLHLSQPALSGQLKALEKGESRSGPAPSSPPRSGSSTPRSAPTIRY
jgi:hypothetical protein